MPNEMRDRLVEILLQKTCHYSDTPCDKECSICGNLEIYRSDIEKLADHLIENGVVVRKRAKWIYATDCYLCSVCAGKRFNLLLGTDAEYCPYCGAKMIFEKEGADNG